MSTLAWITGIVATLGFVMSGVMKLINHEMARDMLGKLGVDENTQKLIGGAEIAGAVALFIGLISDGESYEWLGLVGALGLIAMMIGAVVYHQRAGDEPKEMAPPFMMLAITILFLIAYLAR